MKYFILFFFFSTLSFSQIKEDEEILSFQNELNKEYVDSLKSPLPRNERIHFRGHTFYPTDLAYRTIASFKRTADEKPFKMSTTKGQPKDYIKYGEVEFSINKKKYKLNVYQSLDLVKIEAYKNYLFFPFKDMTNSIETYGGGRFIDLSVPSGTTIIIDFNKAYNPYCAYTDKFSCPIVPTENILATEIKAGIKGPITH